MGFFAQLTTMRREDLVARLDEVAKTTVYGVDFWKQEIFRRDFDKQNETLIRLTRHILVLTVTITVLTVVNVVLVGYTILR